MSEELEERREWVYGIEMPILPDGLQPLECVVLMSGIEMETGHPTITALGSDGMTPWMAIGMMSVETARLQMGYTFHAVSLDEEDDEE